ncbi:hypothetical protein [Solicola gregarius]|nr:hypothetical protein [Solicola gregarius]
MTETLPDGGAGEVPATELGPANAVVETAMARMAAVAGRDMAGA